MTSLIFLARRRTVTGLASTTAIAFIGITLSIASHGNANAQDAASLAADSVIDDVLSQEYAIQIAVRDNPNLAEMQSRFQAMAEVPSQVGALPDPTINLNAMNFPTNSFDRHQEAMTQLQLGFSQMIPFPGKLGLKETSAEFDAIAAGHSLDEARWQLRLQVSTKWWQVHYLDRALETVAKNQDLLRQFITVAKTKYETGQGLQQDVLLSQLELSKLLDSQIQLRSMRRTHAIALNILMDRLPDAVVLLPDSVSTQMPSLLSESQLYIQTKGARARLKQKETEVEAAQTRLKLARRNHYPDFMVGVNYGDRTGSNPLPRGGPREDFASLMIGIKVPLYAGRKQSKAVAQKQNELEFSQHALRDELGVVLAQVSTAVTDYQGSREQFALFESGIIPQARQTVASMLAGYQVDQVDFLNLVRSQMTLFNYELQYWKALSDANQALSSLEAAVGEDSIYE